MSAVVWSVSLTIPLQLLRCTVAAVVAGAADPQQSGTREADAVYGSRANGASPELRAPLELQAPPDNRRIPAQLQSDSRPAQPNTVVGSADTVATNRVYPVLTTGPPMPLAQTEYVTGNPYRYFVGADYYHLESADNDVRGIRRPEYSANRGGSNSYPRWNRYTRPIVLSLLSVWRLPCYTWTREVIIDLVVCVL